MKDVDLTSREWIDLVFEGKNKEFGAYTMRATSTSRHNRSVLYTLLGALIIVGLVFGFKAAFPEEEGKDIATVEQEDMEDSKEEEVEVEEVVYEQPEEQEPEPEQNVEQIEFTELVAQKDDLVKEPPPGIVEVTQTDAEAGKENVIGHERDINADLFEKAGKEDKKIEEPKPVEKPKVEKPFDFVEQMPQFPGGDAALQAYLSSHIKYPPMALENGKSGKCVIKFVVGKDGKVSNATVVRSAGDRDLDKEAVRVVMSLPKFTPGRQNGEAVPVYYTVPVTFKIQ